MNAHPLFQVFAICLAQLLLSVQCPAQTDPHANRCLVILLAGQSNMQGHAVVDLVHPEHYNDGKGTLIRLIEDPEKKKRFAHLHDGKGNWTKRDDVWVRYQTNSTLKKGPLSIGFSGYDGLHHFGPELQLGHVVGDYFDEPVLLIKAAWGGKSLHKDFRPPSAGGDTGEYYRKMIAEFHDGIDNAKNDFPELKDCKFEIGGFVWMQGWNDMINETARDAYTQNLIRLIDDVRTEFDLAQLPVVVGELGNGGTTKNENMVKFRKAQELACVHGPFIGNVDFVPTAPFAQPAEESPNVGHGHHWFGNAESYFLIGDALGKRLVEMTERKNKPNVLILGDSISIGYTNHVRELLPEAYVVRPMRNTRHAENCAGTTNGIDHIDRWLAMGNIKWDVIHFNFGLHDLKHVDAETRKNSNLESDPPQATVEVYTKQLESIVEKLKATGAELIFATTTPVPEGGVKPYRPIDAPAKYNTAAREVMERHNVVINDLFELVESQAKPILRPANVHFTPEGSKILAKQVADMIQEKLQTENK